MNNSSINIVLITNITVQHFFQPQIKEIFTNKNVSVNISTISYLEHETKESICKLNKAEMIIVLLNFEDLYPNYYNEICINNAFLDETKNDAMKKCAKLYAFLKENASCEILWFSFEDYYSRHNELYGTQYLRKGTVDRLNNELALIISVSDIYIDLKRLIAQIGISKAFNTISKYRWNAPYSEELIHLIVDEVYKQYLIATGSTPKCLVLDCDNVLWGGVLSEDGIGGIQVGSSGLGRPFQDFQRYLLDMYHHGVILAVCSKNNELDVLRVFREHTGMVLKEEHIACFRCNWNNKPDNIKYISESLNIGLDSIVFVDDSVFETESVNTMLPPVTTILFKKDGIYDAIACFNLKCNMDIKTVRERTNTYKTNQLRLELQKNTATYEEYMSSLEMIVDIHKTTECERARISELTQRTNRCTNGTRYTLDQIKAKMSLIDYELYTVCLCDKFSNLGVVGVIGIKDRTVDLFSLSCRALGRGVEEKMINYALERKTDRVRFFDLGKNEMLKILFESYDYKLLIN